MADTKLSALTADATPTSDDLLYVVNDPSGTPASKKVTIANIHLGMTAASATVASVVELATIAETDTGTDAARALTPAGLKGSALQTKVDGIEALADVTDTANVTAAGALMDSEVDADIKTLVLPASTTISVFGATLVDDATAAAARTTLGAGTGDGDALVANPLSQFAATTSLQLLGVISDETGTGSLVFGTSPTLVTPALGTPASGVATNLTGYPGDSSLVTTGALNSGSITSGFGNVDIGSSAFGAGAVTLIDNGKMIKSSSDHIRLSIEQQSTGDATIEFLLSAVRSWNIGIDNTDSDKFKFSPVDDSFASAVFEIDISGNVTVAGTVDGIDIATDVAANTTHLSSNGSDHSFIDQDVTSGSTPTLTATNITGVPAASVLAGTLGTGAYVFDNTITGMTNVSGTGNIVLVTSPTLVTPALGTPSAAVLTNATGLVTQTGLASTTGSDTAVVTGTQGTTGELAMWNTDGDLVTASVDASNVLQVSDLGGSVQAYDADTVKYDVAGVFTAQQGFTPATLTDAATIAWDVANAQVAKVTLTANRTMGDPTANAVAGTWYTLVVIQDAGGTNTLAYHANYLWSGDAPVVSAGANDVTILTFYYDGSKFYGFSPQPIDTVLTDISDITFAQGDIMYHDGTNVVNLGPGTSGHYLKTQGAGANPVWAAVAGGGDALVANPLSQFAATTSLQLLGVINDETGTGALVFATSPTLVTPALGTPASGVMTNVTGTAASLTAGNVTTNANLTGHVTSVGNAAVLGSFTSAQLATALTNETGSSLAVFNTSPTLVTPLLGTPTSGVLTNCTGLPAAAVVAGSLGTGAYVFDDKITVDQVFMLEAAAAAADVATFGQAWTKTETPNVFMFTDDAGNDYEVGYKNIPQNSQSAAYTTVLADKGKHILHPSADTTARIFTIDSNANVAYEVGTAITIINQDSAGVVTISITTDTMRLAGAGTTGSRTLAANGIATAVKVTTTEWIISGTGLT